MKNSKYHMNVGGASILLLIAVFAMTVFAVLSIRASYNELRMAEKNRDSVEAYYEADALAEEICGKLWEAWEGIGPDKKADASAVLGGIEELYQGVAFQPEEERLDYFVPVDHNRTIQVTVCFSAEGCRIAGWRMMAPDVGNYDGEEIEIWDGVIS